MNVSLIQTRPITGPAAWKGPDFAHDDSWLHRLDEADIASLDAALAALRARGLQFPDFGREDFPIGSLGARLRGFADELENGRGFLVLRGLPVARYSDDELNALYYGIGLHLGTPVRQNRAASCWAM
jgi:hypothetical protein